MRGGGQERFGASRLSGAWFLQTSEIDAGAEWADAMLNVTGSGTLPIEEKGKPLRDIRNTWGLWFQSNHLPKFRKIDYAMKRRMVLFKVRRAIPIEEVIKDAHTMMIAQEGSAILAWLVQCRNEYKAHGRLYQTPQMLKDRDEYFGDMDKLGTYLNDEYMKNSSGVVTMAELHEGWQRWHLTMAFNEN